MGYFQPSPFPLHIFTSFPDTLKEAKKELVEEMKELNEIIERFEDVEDELEFQLGGSDKKVKDVETTKNKIGELIMRAFAPPKDTVRKLPEDVQKKMDKSGYSQDRWPRSRGDRKMSKWL